MGRAPCCDKANVKKGPWSPEEDAKLKSFIEKFGTGGNWIALPQKIGLKRCGKSCRLRWLNYLRPNIKHGGFSEEEESIICNLYRTIGSRVVFRKCTNCSARKRWSLIAAQLPGRTDNDIKNYWNTRLKKKLLLQIQSNKNQKLISNIPKQEEEDVIKWEYCEEDNTFIMSNSHFFQPMLSSSSSVPVPLPLPSDDQEAAGNYLEQTILLSNLHHHNQSVQSSEDNVGISSMLLQSNCGFDFPAPAPSYYNNNLIAPDDQCHQEADVGYKNINVCRSWDNIGLSESFPMVNNSRISPEIATATATATSFEDIKSPTYFDFEIGKNGNQLLLPDCTSIIEEEPMPFGRDDAAADQVLFFSSQSVAELVLDF